MPVNFKKNLWRSIAALGLAASCGASGLAQQVRFDSTTTYYQTPTGQPAMVQGNVQSLTPVSPNPNFSVPPPTYNSMQPPPNTMVVPTQPPVSYSTMPPGYGVPQMPYSAPAVGNPVFDPYSLNNTPLPTLPGTPPPPMSFGSEYTSPSVMQPNVSNGYYSPGYNPGYPTDPTSTSSTRGASSTASWPSQRWASFNSEFWPRLIERPRWRHTFISGNNGNELALNESEIATTMSWPNFLFSNQPLLTSPGFIFSFWDGPDTAVTGFDLPSVTYAPYITFDSMSDSRKNVGLEGSFTVGMYTDFDNVSSDSWRFMGTGLVWMRLDPSTTFKIGAEYYDRINLKLLPAVGLFVRINNEMNLDLYFPRPRFSHRLPKLGNYDSWSYVGAEIGGGSWTIERMGGFDDQVDVNDVRSFIGIEWTGPRKVTGFFEVGYVFKRQMLYRSDPINELELQDALMLRGGFAF